MDISKATSYKVYVPESGSTPEISRVSEATPNKDIFVPESETTP